jgi:hypothetical protein
MWRHVYLVWTDVSEERIPTIFRVEKSASEEPAWVDGCATSQKTAFFIVTAVKTSNLTYDFYFILRRYCNWESYKPWNQIDDREELEPEDLN